MTQTATAPTATDQPVYVMTDADHKRQQAIQAAWRAYDGDFEPQLEKTPEGIDPNIVVNHCSPIVDTGVDFLFGQEVEISVEEAAPQAAQEVLDSAWGTKETRVPLLQDLAMNGAMARNAFLRIVPSTDMITRTTTYRLVTVDPAIVCVQTAPQDCETVLLYCLQYSSMEKIDGQDRQVFYREEIMRIDPDGNASRGQPDDDDTWQIQHWTQVGSQNMTPKNDGWTPAGAPILWPYAFPPIFHCKNLPRPNDFWGRADVRKDIIGMNNAINLTMSCIQSQDIIYGLPILYSNGVGDAPIQRKVGHIVGLPNPDSKITAVAIPSDTPNALAFAADIRSSLDETSSVPSVATGRIREMPRGQLSGITIELLFMSLLKQNDKKRCLYGKLLIDVSGALLVLAGLAKKIDDLKVTLAWQNPLPHDDLASLQAAVLKKQLGISDTTIQREIGYDPDEEMALSQSEDEIKLKAFIAKQQAAGLPVTPGQPGMPGAQTPPGQPPAQQQQGGMQK